MRRMSRKFGAAYAINEMVLDRSVTYESDWQKRLLDVPADDHPVGAQLMGAEPETFAPAAERLVDAGYDVISAENGPAGLQKFKTNSGIDLVFSDVIMPGGMTGIEMAEEMLKLDPDLPILLTTGYTEKNIRDRIAEFSNIMCVSKPYDTNELPKYVHSMMQNFSKAPATTKLD